LSEKTQIEKVTAEGFIRLYNERMGTDYHLVEISDAPDARFATSTGEVLSLEITLTEDEPGDIQAAVGRSDKRSPEALREHLRRVDAGQEELKIYSLEGNVGENAIRRIRSKIAKRYGPNTALVVRDTSGVDWDWDRVVGHIAAGIKQEANPFDRGIWILSNAKDRLFRVV
jgi:hypothetical protein